MSAVSKYKIYGIPSSSGCPYSGNGKLAIVKDAWKRNGTTQPLIDSLSQYV